MKTPEELAEEVRDLKFKLMHDVATALFGKNLKKSYEITHAICLPISKFVDELLKLREEQNKNT